MLFTSTYYSVIRVWLFPDGNTITAFEIFTHTFCSLIHILPRSLRKTYKRDFTVTNDIQPHTLQ